MDQEPDEEPDDLDKFLAEREGQDIPVVAWDLNENDKEFLRRNKIKPE